MLWLRDFGKAAIDLVLPPHCAACGEPSAQHAAVCGDCFRALTFIVAPACRRCALPLASEALAGSVGEMAGLCDACRVAPPPWSAAAAAFAYDGTARALILPLKYGGREEVARLLAGHMARAGAALLAGAELVVPVPLHRTRLRERGYNQAALLARGVARAAGRPLGVDALRRMKATVALASLGARDRAEEIEGAIGVAPRRLGAVAGRAVLLVDDVLTSGATARACAGALLDGGARRVDLLVAARTVGGGQDRAAGVDEEDDEG